MDRDFESDCDLDLVDDRDLLLDSDLDGDLLLDLCRDRDRYLFFIWSQVQTKKKQRQISEETKKRNDIFSFDSIDIWFY